MNSSNPLMKKKRVKDQFTRWGMQLPVTKRSYSIIQRLKYTFSDRLSNIQTILFRPQLREMEFSLFHASLILVLLILRCRHEEFDTVV